MHYDDFEALQSTENETFETNKKKTLRRRKFFECLKAMEGRTPQEGAHFNVDLKNSFHFTLALVYNLSSSSKLRLQ
ncbi:CLUMA_CG007603, isoform A [Clunio marinus]|uniref:CLUMA_CG007603, isoform A n=1 Tax=Clunio marinus TaxID=568069 RepID=A0A1J1I171_9DIPT|nr:CLUMA_CG007603, isoform A [Clunio marinus]